MTFTDMNGSTKQVDEKILERVRKLLAVAAKGSNATEAEATAFAQKAAALMEEHGLTMMALETSENGKEGEGRGKEAFKVERARWHDTLMAAIAESCFCYVETYKQRNVHLREFRLIGRLSAVTTAKITYEYLVKAVLREHKASGHSGRELFCTGAAERIAERLHVRHEQRLREQRAEAEKRREEQEARARHPGAAPSSTALVVTLHDYAQRERDLNNDFLYGYKPGETSRRREEASAKNKSNDAKIAAMVAEGIAYGVAWNMVFLNMTRERAEEYEVQWNRKQERETNRRRKEWTRADEAAWARTARDRDRRSSEAFLDGRQAGDKIGLDTQVGYDTGRRIK